MDLATLCGIVHTTHGEAAGADWSGVRWTMRGDGRRRWRSDEGGAALVEFALILPLLAIITFGTVDVGRAYMQWNRVKNAAREGANYAQYNPSRQIVSGSNCTNPDNIAYRARAEAGNGTDASYSVLVNGSASLTCTTYNPTTWPPGTNVTVTVSKPFTVITPLISAFMGNVTTSAAVTVNIQGPGS